MASLNYDILLDRAMRRELGKVCYSPEAMGPLLVKPHRSCNMLVDHPNLITPKFILEMKGDGHGELDFPPIPSFETPRILEELIRNDPIPPIMRVYATKKYAPVGSSWLKFQQNLLIQYFNSAKAIIVVGVRVNATDDHIWGELMRTSAEVFLVNRDIESRDFLIQKYGNANNWINNYFTESLHRIARIAKSSSP